MAGRTVAKKFGGGSQRLVFFLGLVLAAIAAVIVFAAVNGADSGGGGGGSAGPVPVVVAAQDIAAGTTIEAHMVTDRSVAKGDALSGHFEKSKEVVGKTTVVSIVSGEQIVTSRVVGAGEAGRVVQADSLAEAVPLQKPPATCSIDNCGQRGVSIAVADVTASGGLILAGDRVDVLLAFQDASAVTILQDVEVLSIDQDLEKVVAVVPSTETDGEERTVVSDSEVEENPTATTATLAVWPQEAQPLVAAEEFMKGESISLTAEKAAELGLPADTEFDCKGSVRLILRHVGQEGPVALGHEGVCSRLFVSVWGAHLGIATTQ